MLFNPSDSTLKIFISPEVIHGCYFVSHKQKWLQSKQWIIDQYTPEFSLVWPLISISVDFSHKSLLQASRGYNITMDTSQTIINASAEGIQAASVEISNTISLAAQSQPNYVLYVIAVITILIGIIIFRNRKSSNNKKEIALIGQRGSGKTQLFISLSGGKRFQTVPSIENNHCEIQLGRNKYRLCDFIGDNLSKEEVVNEIARFHTLVQVVDGADSKRLADASLCLYRILINKLFQKEPCNYVIFLNKEDDKQFHGIEKLVKRLQDEVETIKVARRNQPEENQGDQDYLRNERTRFDLKKQGIDIVVGSARKNIDALKTHLEETCG